MQHRIEILEIGVLHHYGLTTREFQAGLDMVVAILLDIQSITNSKPSVPGSTRK
jgi:hypothetical protein